MSFLTIHRHFDNTHTHTHVYVFHDILGRVNFQFSYCYITAVVADSIIPYIQYESTNMPAVLSAAM